MESTKRIGVLASGNGTNLQALIDCADLRSAIALVVVNNPEAFAKTRAERADIPVATIDHRGFASRADFDRALVNALKSAGVEFVVLAGFMRIVGPEMLEAYRDRIINIHPALLPAFAGLHAQRQALAAGVKISGCSVHLVDAGTDTGPILAQAAVPILPGDDEAALSARILRREHLLLPAVLRAILAGRLRIEAPGRPELEGGPLLDEGEVAPSGEDAWLLSPPAETEAAPGPPVLRGTRPSWPSEGA
jgi:phosphoribosylglycinamide formyltransferase-1